MSTSFLETKSSSSSCIGTADSKEGKSPLGTAPGNSKSSSSVDQTGEDAILGMMAQNELRILSGSIAYAEVISPGIAGRMTFGDGAALIQGVLRTISDLAVGGKRIFDKAPMPDLKVGPVPKVLSSYAEVAASISETQVKLLKAALPSGKTVYRDVRAKGVKKPYSRKDKSVDQSSNSKRNSKRSAVGSKNKKPLVKPKSKGKPVEGGKTIGISTKKGSTPAGDTSTPDDITKSGAAIQAALLHSRPATSSKEITTSEKTLVSADDKQSDVNLRKKRYSNGVSKCLRSYRSAVWKKLCQFAGHTDFRTIEKKILESDLEKINFDAPLPALVRWNIVSYKDIVSSSLDGDVRSWADNTDSVEEYNILVKKAESYGPRNVASRLQKSDDSEKYQLKASTASIDLTQKSPGDTSAKLINPAYANEPISNVTVSASEQQLPAIWQSTHRLREKVRISDKEDNSYPPIKADDLRFARYLTSFKSQSNGCYLRKGNTVNGKQDEKPTWSQIVPMVIQTLNGSVPVIVNARKFIGVSVEIDHTRSMTEVNDKFFEFEVVFHEAVKEGNVTPIDYIYRGLLGVWYNGYMEGQHMLSLFFVRYDLVSDDLANYIQDKLTKNKIITQLYLPVNDFTANELSKGGRLKSIHRFGKSGKPPNKPSQSSKSKQSNAAVK